MAIKNRTLTTMKLVQIIFDNCCFPDVGLSSLFYKIAFFYTKSPENPDRIPSVHPDRCVSAHGSRLALLRILYPWGCLRPWFFLSWLRLFWCFLRKLTFWSVARSTDPSSAVREKPKSPVDGRTAWLWLIYYINQLLSVKLSEFPYLWITCNHFIMFYHCCLENKNVLQTGLCQIPRVL